jgi:hypothetical protein
MSMPTLPTAGTMGSIDVVEEGTPMMIEQQARPKVQSLPAPPSAPRRPTKLGYAVGALIAVMGLFSGLAWGFSAYGSYLDDAAAFPRVSVPGTEVVRLPAGDHVVYYEGLGPLPSELEVTIVDAEGATVRTARGTGDLRYDAPDGTVGRAFSEFTLSSGGVYGVTVEALPEAAHVAIGEGLPGSTIVSVVGALAVILASGAVGLLLMVVTAIRRAR